MDLDEARASMAAIGPASACTDGERRSAVWARDALRRDGHDARLQTEWVRPGWPSVYGAHGALAIAGSLLSAVGAELVGLLLAATATVSLAGELTGRMRLLRLLLPVRATQNLIAAAADSGLPRLVVYANVDAPRTVRRSWLPLRLMWAGMLLLVLLAGLRLDGESSTALSLAQFVVCLVVLAGVASMLEFALAEAGAFSAAAASALVLFGELRRGGLRGLAVELVLGGAGDEQGLGLSRYISARDWRAEDVVLLSIESGGGGVSWRTHDGLLVPLRMHPRLCALMQDAADGEAGLNAAARRAWGCSGAYVGRSRGWASIAVEGEDSAAVIELCLAWVGLLDAELARVAQRD